MLGLGTRLFISSETSYGVERPDRYTEQGGTASGDYKDMYTYYILNDRITTSFNQSSVDYISDHRGKRNIFHKNVNNIYRGQRNKQINQLLIHVVFCPFDLFCLNF